MKTIGVLIVDDSAFMRKLLSDFINEDPNMHVVGIARNGSEVLSKVEKWNPDVVTLDVELPDMDGLTVLKQLMAKKPMPVVMVSTMTQKGAQTTLEAMAWGAIDFVAKPSGAISHDLHKVKDELVAKIKMAANVNINHSNDHPIVVQKIKQAASKVKSIQKLICIGASTGGPRALQTVISGLPKGLSAPVFIVQHLPASFTTSFAERLNSLSASLVKEAENGETVRKGIIYLAPGGYHLKVKKRGQSLVIELDDSASVHGVKPAFDILLKSIADLEEQDPIVAVLTGMGSDGASGLLEIKKRMDLYAIAESSETAVIFGMPKAAIQTGAINSVVPLQHVASEIVDQLNK